jgi:shikimate kinase
MKQAAEIIFFPPSKKKNGRNVARVSKNIKRINNTDMENLTTENAVVYKTNSIPACKTAEKDEKLRKIGQTRRRFYRDIRKLTYLTESPIRNENGR